MYSFCLKGRECGTQKKDVLLVPAETMNVETKYLRMIRGMKREGRKDWTVYILRCGDGSLYTGIAKDVQARIKQHSEGRGAAYTRARLPVTLLYQQEGLTHSKALIREAQIKAMPRAKKEEMIFNGHRAQSSAPGDIRI